MTVYLSGVGLCAPGLPDWPTARAVLDGRQAYRPDEPPRFDRINLPRNEARRATLTVRLALQAAAEALTGTSLSPACCGAVFACAGGNTEALDALCQALIEPGRPISPSQFNHSVHNAPLGYWSIATGATRPAVSIGAYDASFAAGLLEASALVEIERQPVVLVAYDTPPPLALQPFRSVTTPFGVALLLTPEALPGSIASLGGWHIEYGVAEGLGDGALERVRLGNPAARSLPLLQAVTGMGGYSDRRSLFTDSTLLPANERRITLPYLPGQRLELCARAWR